MVSKNSKILVTGGSGFLGSKLVKLLNKKGYRNLIIPRSKKYDLKKASNCYKLSKETDIVIHLAANVGGIGYNKDYPATLFYDNLMMGINMLHQAFVAKVKKFISVGTVCAYPKYTPVPFKEDYLWNGYPEETNAPYGLAKKMLLVGSQAYRNQFGFNAIHLIPVNLYGPGDNFNLKRSHVIPALIHKIYYAKIKKQRTVTVWGTGRASREFLYVDDAARAILLAMERYNKPDPVNIGCGVEITIADLIDKIIKIINYKGEVIWDKTKPDGQPRRLLNTDLAYKEFGFKATVNFNDGLRKTINWYINTYGK